MTSPIRGGRTAKAQEYTLPTFRDERQSQTLALPAALHPTDTDGPVGIAGNSARGLFSCHTKTVTLKNETLERTLPLLLLGLAVVAVPMLVWSPAGLPRLERLRKERTELHEKAARLSEEIRELQAEVARVKSDPSLLEQVARDELGLVRQTEVVFQFTP